MNDREIGDTVRWVASCLALTLIMIAIIIGLVQANRGPNGSNLVCNVSERPAVVAENRDWQHNVLSQEYKCIVANPR